MLLEQFCEFLREIGNSDATVRNRRGDIKGLTSWFETRHNRKFELRQFVTEDIPEYRGWLFSQFKATTANRRLTSLSVFLKWAAAKRLIRRQEFPALRHSALEQGVREIPPSLDQSEQKRLFESVARSGDLVATVAISLMVNCGLRVSELYSLKWEDVSVVNGRGTVSIPTSKLKSRSAVSVPLPDSVREALASLWKVQASDPGSYVLSGPKGRITRRAIEMLVNRYGRKADLSNLTPKVLRHTFIMNLVRSGIDPRLILMWAGNEVAELARLHGSVRLPEDPTKAYKF
jgi:integrase/recombinase XerC